MRVKKFQANNMAQAMKLVKAELGPNAIILHSRDLGKGLLGFFLGRGVEVTAGVDPKETRKPEPPPSPKNEPNPLLHTPPQNQGGNPAATRPPNAGRQVDFRVNDGGAQANDNPLLALSQKLQQENQDLKKEMNKNPAPPPKETKTDSEAQTPPDPPGQPLEKRLNSMENQLSKLTHMIENLIPSLSGSPASPIPYRTRELYNHLLEQDVDESLALTIATQIAETSDENDDMWTALKAHLTHRLQSSSPIELDFDAKIPKIILLIGPTGVGKTTTLAKISAQYRYSTQSQKRPKIVFITADLYRLAAVEQLQKYTEILGCELEVTYSPEEAKQAIQKHKDANLILFDTAGTCQRNLPQMGTLKSICEASEPTEIHLVLSATTKFSDLIDVVEHFKEVHPDRFIFTKIDESTTYGTLLNIQHKYQVPISYLTTGQNVPEDIEQAKPERIAKLLMTKPTVNRSMNEITTMDSKPKKEEGKNTSFDTGSTSNSNENKAQENHDEK